MSTSTMSRISMSAAISAPGASMRASSASVAVTRWRSRTLYVTSTRNVRHGIGTTTQRRLRGLGFTPRLDNAHCARAGKAAPMSIGTSFVFLPLRYRLLDLMFGLSWPRSQRRLPSLAECARSTTPIDGCLLLACLPHLSMSRCAPPLPLSPKSPR